MAKKQRGAETVCPRVPDFIGVVGDRLAFVLDDAAFFITYAGEMTEVDLQDEVESACFAPAGVAFTDGAVLWRFTANCTALDVDDMSELEAVRILPGWDVALALAAPAHLLLRLAPPAVLPLPEGATRARFAAPFSTGVGMVWVDLEQVYRLREGTLPAALGRAPKPLGLAVGPDGAFAIQLEKDTLLASPRGVAVRLGSVIDVESTRFSPDGLRALALDEDGAVLLDLSAGKEITRWDGDFLPLGFAPEPILLDGATGSIVTADGSVLIKRFCPPLQD